MDNTGSCKEKNPHMLHEIQDTRAPFRFIGWGGGHMSHLSLLRFVLTLIVCPQKACVEGGHRSRRVEVPQHQGGHYHVVLRAMLLCPCTLGCRRSAGFLRQASVLRRAALNQDASYGWRVPRRFQVTLHDPSSPSPSLDAQVPTLKYRCSCARLRKIGVRVHVYARTSPRLETRVR